MASAPKKPRMSDQDFADLKDIVGAIKSGEIPKEDVPRAREFVQMIMEQRDPPMSAQRDPINAMGRGFLDLLNYGGGLMQTGLLDASSRLGRGGDSVITAKDWKDALNPLDARPAPSPDEVLKRAGVPAGPKLSDVLPGYAEPGKGEHWYTPEKGGALDPTARGTAAAALGMLTPRTLFTAAKSISPDFVRRLENALGYNTPNIVEGMSAQAMRNEVNSARAAEKNASNTVKTLRQVPGLALDLGGTSLEKAGRAIYNAPFKAADAATTKRGKMALTDVLREAGQPTGTSQQIRNAVDAEQSRLRQTTAGNIAQLTAAHPEAGVTVGELLDKPKLVVKAYKKVPTTKAQAESVWRNIRDKFSDKEDQLDLSTLNKVKTTADDRKAALGGFGRSNGTPNTNSLASADEQVKAEIGKEAYGAVGDAARQAVEDTADKLVPGAGGKIFMQNAKESSILSAKPALDELGNRSLRSQTLPAIGTGMVAGMLPLLAGGLDHATTALPLALAAGGVRLLGNTVWAQTHAGKLLEKYGPTANDLLRGYLMQKYGEKARTPNQWTLLQQSLNQENP